MVEDKIVNILQRAQDFDEFDNEDSDEDSEEEEAEIEIVEMEDDVPDGWYLMTVAQLQDNWKAVLDMLPNWHVCALEDGSISGRGHGNKIDRDPDFDQLGHKLIINQPEPEDEDEEDEEEDDVDM